MTLTGLSFATQRGGRSEAIAAEWSNPDSFSLTGELRQELAYRYVDPASFTKVRFLGLFNVNYTPSPTFGIHSVIQLSYDAVYNFESVDSIVQRRNPSTLLPDQLTAAQINALQVGNIQSANVNPRENEVRDLYAEWRLRQWNIRAGRQIVRWNVLEGSRVVDEINPLDFKEWILRPITERTIPLLMLRVDYYPEDWTIEGIWIPFQVFHEPAPKGSEWEQLQTLENTQNAPRTFQNSEWGLKVSRLFGSWGLSLSYFDTWDDFPTSFRTIVGGGTFGTAPDVVFHPEATRLHIIGSTLTNNFGSVVLGTEFAYVFGKYFGLTLPPFDPATGTFLGGTTLQLTTGEAQQDYLKYAVGIDTRLWQTDWSFQIQQEFIPQYVPETIQDRLSTLIGIFGRRELSYGKTIVEALALYFINEQGYLIRPKVTWKLTDSLKLSVGADLFKGTIGGPLPGEFNFAGFFVNHDRIYTELAYNF